MPRQNALANRVALSAVVVVAALPLLYLAVTQRIEFDGYWNAFVAIQDKWKKFLAEYHANPHPPLYYLVLRASLWFGRSHLAYRAPSVLAGLASVYLVGSAASRLARSFLWGLLAALAYGLAIPSIVVALEVRGYMLCTFFILLSYCFLLDVLTREGPAGTTKLRIAFAATAALACLADYYSFFYVAAVFGIAVILAVLRPSGSRGKALLREAVTFAPVLAVMAFLFRTNARENARVWGHLRPFYYGQTAGESRGGFVLRNLQNDFNLFFPWKVENQTAFLAILAGLLVAGGATLWLMRRLKEPKNLPAAVTVVATAVMTMELMLVGLRDKYPFGGDLRHQFLLFPFLILCAIALLDRVAAAVPRPVAWALAGILTVSIAVVGYVRFEAYPRVPETLMSGQMAKFNQLFPAPAAVYVDSYNLYWFFMHHDDWKWESEGPARLAPGIEVYRLTRGDRRMLVFEDTKRWVLELDDASLYADLTASMRSESLDAVDVFRIAQQDQPQTTEEIAESRKLATTMAATHGVCLQPLSIYGSDEFGEVRAGACDGGEITADVGSLH